jgi:hypothetical protein
MPHSRRRESKEDFMKLILIGCGAMLAAQSAFAYKPATEQEFSQIASEGCKNRNGDFIIRGMVSSANENTLVLSDPAISSSTISVALPGRGPLARAKGLFGRNKYQASDERLNELRATRTAVVVTLKCKGNATPIARNISYVNADGSRSSISF